MYDEFDGDEGCDCAEVEWCDSCTDDTFTYKTVVARKPRTEEGRERRERNGIRPGDTILVRTGYMYKIGGPRIKFHPVYEKIISKGPNWPDDQRAYHELKNLLVKPEWLGESTLQKRLAQIPALARSSGSLLGTRDTALMRRMVQSYLKKVHTRLANEVRDAEWQAVRNAKPGDVVSYRGKTYRVGQPYNKTRVHSSAEYRGHFCDVSVRTQWDLVPTDGRGATIVAGPNVSAPPAETLI